MMTRDEFNDEMWLTYKARFNAHSRLLNQEMLYTVTISFLSFFVIAINILQLIPELVGIKQNATTFYTITISIFILIISLINNFSARRHNAERFHKCALEIKGLYGKFSAMPDSMPNEDYIAFIKKYNSIQQKYEINHLKCDYQQVLIGRKGTYFKDKLFFYIKYFIETYLFCIILLIIPIVFGLIIIFIK